ncbi:MAG TPA: hypothetical protein VHO07_24815, partial [Streptosporangiaceae bacterium]|nr:hypothetical protein [Streptosporangiaceae bacterium]
PATGAQRTPGPATGAQRTPGPATGAQRTPGPGTSGPGTSRPWATGPGPGPQRVPGPQQRLESGTGAQWLTGYSSGAQPALGTGTQPALGTGTGAQPALGNGTGAQPALGNGTGAQPALDRPASPGPSGRTPVRGFPPRRAEPETPPGSSAWHQPGEPLTGEDHELRPDGGYGQDGAGENTNLPDDMAPIARVDPQPPTTFAVPVGRRRSAKAKPKRRLLSRPALLATVAAVVLAAAFGGYKLLYEPRVNAPVSPSLRLPTSAPGSPGSPDFNQSLGKWQHIGTRTEDPGPLTIEGLYPPQFMLNGSSYVRAAASVTTNCSEAVYGAQLQAALQSGHCSQVARASYISGNGQLMGTVGVVNLITSTAAQKAGQASGPQEVIAPLAAKKGATRKLGDGTGVVLAEVKGHYLILMWAQFADLKSPSTPAARQLLEQFSTNLVTGSANINLSTRMLAGKA